MHAGEASPGMERSTELLSVAKPASDTRCYRAVTLDNGVRALLVQDTEATFAAACASVQVCMQNA